MASFVLGFIAGQIGALVLYVFLSEKYPSLLEKLKRLFSFLLKK